MRRSNKNETRLKSNDHNNHHRITHAIGACHHQRVTKHRIRCYSTVFVFIFFLFSRNEIPWRFFYKKRMKDVVLSKSKEYSWISLVFQLFVWHCLTLSPIGTPTTPMMIHNSLESINPTNVPWQFTTHTKQNKSKCKWPQPNKLRYSNG